MSDHYETRCPSCGGSDEQGCYADCPTHHITALEARVRELEKAGRYISPYLEWTIGPESPGYHPTMPSAVGAFLEVLARAALNQEKQK